MDMNYGCDVSNRYTAYLDSDHGNPMNNASGKNKRKTKKRRKPKNVTQEIVTVVDKCTNTSQIIESDGNDEQQQQPEQQQQHQEPLFNGKNTEIHVEHNENDAAHYTDGPTSLISSDSTAPSDTSKEAKESDEQSNITNEDPTATTATEPKWSVICYEEEKAAAAAAAMNAQKIHDEPELEFKDQRIYPTVYFYNSNFGMRHRRVVYDFHDGHRFGGQRQYSQNYRDDFQMRSEAQVNQNDGTTETNDQMQNKKQKKRRNRNIGHRRKNYARSDTTDHNNPGDTSELHSADDASHHESNDRTSHGQSSPTPPAPPPSAPKYNNNTREYSKNRFNKFKHGMPDRTFTRRRTDLVRNV